RKNEYNALVHVLPCPKTHKNLVGRVLQGVPEVSLGLALPTGTPCYGIHRIEGCEVLDVNIANGGASGGLPSLTMGIINGHYAGLRELTVEVATPSGDMTADGLLKCLPKGCPSLQTLRVKSPAARTCACVPASLTHIPPSVTDLCLSVSLEGEGMGPMESLASVETLSLTLLVTESVAECDWAGFMRSLPSVQDLSLTILPTPNTDPDTYSATVASVVGSLGTLLQSLSALSLSITIPVPSEVVNTLKGVMEIHSGLTSLSVSMDADDTSLHTLCRSLPASLTSLSLAGVRHPLPLTPAFSLPLKALQTLTLTGADRLDGCMGHLLASIPSLTKAEVSFMDPASLPLSLPAIQTLLSALPCLSMPSDQLLMSMGGMAWTGVATLTRGHTHTQTQTAGEGQTPSLKSVLGSIRLAHGQNLFLSMPSSESVPPAVVQGVCQCLEAGGVSGLTIDTPITDLPLLTSLLASCCQSPCPVERLVVRIANMPKEALKLYQTAAELCPATMFAMMNVSGRR
ncbi:hypothetical protein KIPB_003058, partial [Kipferlia bialata]